MKFTLTIDTDSIEFDEDPAQATARALIEQAAFFLRLGHAANDLRDSEGHFVGRWRLDINA